MPELSPPTPDVRPIHQLIRRARLLLRTTWGATGLGLTVGIGLSILCVLIVTDLTSPLSTGFRLVGLCLLLVPTAGVFLAGFVVPLLRRLGAIDIARRIEAHIPGMHSRLVSCVDLASGESQKSSPAFYRRLVDESLERIRDFRPFRIVDATSLRRALGFAGIAALLFAGLYLGLTERVPTAVARILHPLEDIPPISSVAYDVEPGTTRILKGDDIAFRATITRGEPSKLTLELYGSDGQVLRFDLEADADSTTWTATRNTANLGIGFEKSFTYRIIGGGTWSKLYSVALLERPTITSIQASIFHPGYMALPEPRIYPPQVTDVTGPAAGEVEIVIEADGNVAEQEIQLLEQRTIRTEFNNREPQIWFTNELPKGAQADPTWKWRANHLGRSMTHYGNGEMPRTAIFTPHSHSFTNALTGMPVHNDEHLFAFVYLDPARPTKSIMLQWQDETGSWEHRAFWGEDLIPFGETGTVAHHAMGPIPDDWMGRWIRLEVPARSVGLEGKVVRGMGFAHLDGEVHWAEVGVGLPSFEERNELTVIGRHPMERVTESANRYRGRFPLNGSGLYRIELRNELGAANKPMKEAKYEATPDQPPEILLERPAVDLTLSKPDIVHLQAIVRDDYGLEEVWLAMQREGELRYSRVQSIQKYASPNPMRNDAILFAMDLAGLGVKVGETIRYRLEVHDRSPNREATRSKDYLIRVTPDPNAADKQLDQFEKLQAAFRGQLIQLVADQSKIRDRIEQTAQQYQKLESKIRAIRDADSALPPAPPNPVNPPKTESLPVDLTPAQLQKLTPDERREWAELRQQLTNLGAEEAKNAQLAERMQNGLNQLADRAGKLPLLPQEIANEVQSVQQVFERQVQQPLQDLTARLQQQGAANHSPSDLKRLDQQAERVQNSLEAIQRRMDALSDAQRDLKGANKQQALEQLKSEMLRERGRFSATELEQLQNEIHELRGDLERLQERQDDLATKTAQTPNAELPRRQRQQQTLEDLIEPKLRQAHEILNDPRTQKMTSPKRLDASPEVDPKRKENLDPEENFPERKKPDPKKSVPANDEKEPSFQPALAKEKLPPEPRSDSKKPRPDSALPTDEQRESLLNRQEQNVERLESAQRSLEADERVLEKMLHQLKQQNEQAQKSPMSSEQPGESAEMNQALDELKQALQSEQMQKAMRMAQRAQQASRPTPGGSQQAHQPPPPMQSPQGNLQGGPAQANTDADLSRFDLQTRAILMQMRPQLREELLQGMKEEGPDGYRKFIADYFKRLSELQQPGK